MILEYQYNDIFKQVKSPNCKNAKFIRGVISNHRYNAMRSNGFVRMWNNFQANQLERKLNKTLDK